MSRTIDDDDDRRSGEFTEAVTDFGDMVRRGRSFSGHERNCCFLNTGDTSAGGQAAVRRFADVSALSGIDFPDDGRAVAAVDWDHDGDLDLWISNRNAPRLRLLRNNAPRHNHFIALRLIGAGGTTNRDAIGARVEVILESETPTPRSIKTARAGDAFLSQSSKWLHFGLGRAAGIKEIVVRWPGGETERFTGVEVDRRYRLKQGSGLAQLVPARSVELSPTEIELPVPTSTARVPVVSLLPMSDLSYVDLQGVQQTLPIGRGKPVLVNLWASWCQPCLAELQDLAKHERELRAAGIEVVALTVDGLGDDTSSPAAAGELVERLKFPFTTGRANARLISYMQTLHDFVLTRLQVLPVPVSFLIDENGRVAVIYKGRLSVQQLLDDLQHSRGTLAERFARSAPITGRTLPFPSAARQLNQWQTRFHFATYLQSAGYSDSAAALYKEVISLRPDDAIAHNNLGIIYAQRAQTAQAKEYFEEAVRLKPNYDKAFSNLGMLLLQQGDLGAAEKQFQQALRYGSGVAEHHQNYGRLLIERKRWPDAQLQFEQSLASIKIRPDAHTYLGAVLAQQLRSSKAGSISNEHWVDQPNQPGASANLVLVRRWISQGKP